MLLELIILFVSSFFFFPFSLKPILWYISSPVPLKLFLSKLLLTCMLQKLEVTSKFFEVHDPITTPWNTFSTKLIAHYTLLISYVFTCYSHFRLPYWLYFSFPTSGYLKISILKTFPAGSQTYFQSYESQGQLMATRYCFSDQK